MCIGDVYGDTVELLGDNAPQVGITTTFLRADEVGRLPEVLYDRTRIVFFETPSNPTLGGFDIAVTPGQARAAGALTVVDNTFATPVNQNPLAQGADLVVHSATKYLGGHSDLTAGALMGPHDLLAPVAMWRKNLGQVIAPETAGLLARSIRSLTRAGARIERRRGRHHHLPGQPSTRRTRQLSRAGDQGRQAHRRRADARGRWRHA